MTKYIIGAFALLIIGGCAPKNVPIIISDISNSMVKIETSRKTWLYSEVERSEIDAEASRGCDQFNKSAFFISVRCIYNDPVLSSCLKKEYLFACK